ncbi:hypothetical protein HPB48_000695 [Haemaphysalis longicornis]|uniref:Uncharacterized protein n=1 Tax=Haemaphysalis longicornis TaxID=44386 RepID=A0A9J6H1K3_HAELO|nr:hypothetical protein HPB48_000695 [Haemaphysalis longicornis]
MMLKKLDFAQTGRDKAPEGVVRLLVNVMRESGRFQVSKNDIVGASGRIRMADGDVKPLNLGPPCTPEEGVLFELEAADIYKELRLRGYQCKGMFQGILRSDVEFRRGKLKWEDNWVTFIDAMLQFLALSNHHRASTQPVQIEFCSVDPKAHANVTGHNAHAGVDIAYERYLQTCSAGGVVIRDVVFSPISTWKDQVPLVEEYNFVPFFDRDSNRQQRQDSMQAYIEMCSAIVRRILDLCAPNCTHNTNLFSSFPGGIALTLDHVPEDPAESCVLLRTLITILNSVKDSPSSLDTCVKSAQSLNKTDLEQDILNTALFQEDPLRFLLDIVTENIYGTKIRVLELTLEKDSLLLAPWVRSLLSMSKTWMKIEYVVGHVFPGSLISEEPLEGVTITNLASAISSESGLFEADLIVARIHTGDPTEVHSLLEKLSSYCKRNAFVFIAMRTCMTPAELFLKSFCETPHKSSSCQELQAAFEDNQFRLIAHYSNNLSSLLLFRLCSPPCASSTQEVVKVESANLDWVKTLKEKALNCESGQPGQTLWIVGENGGLDGTLGLMTCLRQESVGRNVRCVFDAGRSGSKKLSEFSPSNPEYRDIVERDLVMNVYCDGQWGSYRHIAMQPSGALKKTAEFACVNVSPGNPSSVHWYESSLPYKSPCTPRAPSTESTERVLCNVYFAPLNYQDSLIATRNLRQTSVLENLATFGSALGIEFSGRDPCGRRVIGLVASEAIATVVAADPQLLWEVPTAWSLQEASTVPVAYSVAYYALLIRGNMHSGESLLILGGSCDVGQAAISIALSMGCMVFTTVGSAEEHQFLKCRFPELGERHIVNTKETSFDKHILLQTEGTGVSLVLSSRTQDALQSTLRCISPNGRFLDIHGFDDVFEHMPLENSMFLRNITFHHIPVYSLFGDDPSAAAVKRSVAKLLRDGIASGAVRPLDTTVFGRDKVEEAFQFMGSSIHIGKVVIEIRPEKSEGKAVAAPSLSVEAVARTWFYESKSYVIIGGLGGFGLELADWMVSRGCRKLLLCSRSPVRNGYQRLCLHRLEQAGAKVLVSTADASTESGAREIIETAMTLGAVGGVFNSAVVLANALLENLSVEDFKTACKPKVDISQRLDQLTRNICPELDHFVVFSSVACGRGSNGQTNYGYANSFMERICERRVADGFPALAIQWGAVADVGIFHETVGSDIEVRGTLPQRISSCLEVLDRFLSQKVPVVASLVRAGKSPSAHAHDQPDLVQSIAHILGMTESSSLKPHISLGEFGLDSLTGVAVQDTIERHTGRVLSMREVRQLNLKALEELSHAAIVVSEKNPTAMKKER